MGLIIEELNNDNQEKWEDYIGSRDDSTFVDRPAWRELVQEIYGLRNYWVMALNKGRVEGILALTLATDPMFRRYLATAPFGNQGGFYAESESAHQALLATADKLHRRLKAQYTVVRHLDASARPPEGWQQDTSYATYHLSLHPDPQILLRRRLSSNLRSKISRARRNGLSVEFGHLEYLDHFWSVISRSMRELGSPYHSKRYLETLMKKHGVRAEFAVLYLKGRVPVGGGLLMHHQDRTVILHANCLKEARRLYPGEFLYWSVIEACCRKGVKVLDMGRSLAGSGNESFKMKWRPVRHQLAYWYRLSPGMGMPGLNQNNPRFQPAIKAWQRLPLWFSRLIGPRLISGVL